MFLYLVQHGEAKREEEDPLRGLTEKGTRAVVGWRPLWPGYRSSLFGYTTAARQGQADGGNICGCGKAT